jgi:beta-lactamase regulating signal transducer with metallopeptidase domain
MFGWLIQHTVESAALAAAVWLLCRCFRPSPAARHALWLVVLAKLLTPPLVHWPWSLPTPFPGAAVAPAAAPQPVAPPRTEAAAPSPAAADAFPPPDEEIFTAPLHGRKAADGPAAATQLPFSAASAADPWPWPAAAAEWTWAAGCVLAALLQLVRIVRLGRRISRGRRPAAVLEVLLTQAAQALNMRTPRILVLPGPSSPMVCALGATRLLWPDGLEERLPRDGVRTVLLHELAHIRRRDHLVGWLVLVGECVWWWHPLFWWVRRRLTHEAELACDSWVTAAAPESRKAYAEALLEVSKCPPAAAAPVLGASSGRRDLERRLIMVMRHKTPARLSWVGLVGVGLLGLVVLPAWSLGQGDPPKSPAPSAAPPSASTAPGPVVNERDFDVVGSAPAAAPGATAAGDPAAEDREKRIRDLEAKVQSLLKELAGLQSPTATDALGLRAPIRLPAPDAAGPTGPLAPTSPADEVTLSRVTYKLPAGHAEATAAFLRDHVGASVLETQAVGDNLIVTTTPETQKIIKSFIALVQARPPAPTPSVGGPDALPPGPPVDPNFGPPGNRTGPFPSLPPGPGVGPLVPPGLPSAPPRTPGLPERPPAEGADRVDAAPDATAPAPQP